MHGANNEQQAAAPESRREFFYSTVRYAVLGALTVGAVVLGRRSVTRLPNQACVNQGFCGGCSAYAGCGLPQALSAKSVAATRQSAAIWEVRDPESEIRNRGNNGGSLPSSRYEESL